MSAIPKDVRIGRDEKEKFLDCLEENLLNRMGMLPPEEQRSAANSNPLLYAPLSTMATEWCIRNGVPAKNPMTEASHFMAMRGGALATGDFTQPGDVIENVASKKVLSAYVEANEVWPTLAKQSAVRDFRDEDRVKVSIPTIGKRQEDQTIGRGMLSGEAATLSTNEYGSIFGLTRETVLADDIAVFRDAFQNIGSAAARVIGDQFYSDLIASTNIFDGNPLFDSAHSNVGTPGALSLTTITEARKLLRKMPLGGSIGGANNVVLNSPAAYLLVPAALEGEAESLSAGSTTERVFQEVTDSSIEVLVDARLDANSETAFYLFTAPSRLPCYEVAGIKRLPGPSLEVRNNPDTAALEFKLTLDVAATFIDWRGVVRNVGA